MAQAQYWTEITNDYLGKHRRITGRSRREVELKAAEQLHRWSEQEMRAREQEMRARDRAAIAYVKEQAVASTEAAQALIDSYRGILHATLAVDDRLNWQGIMDPRPFARPRPTLEEARAAAQVPRERPMLERVGLSSKSKRLAAEQEAEAAHEAAVAQWESHRQAYEAARRAHNGEIEAFRAAYEAGDPEAVERYVSLVLASSAFPEGFTRECQVAYSASDRTLIVESSLPTPEDIPTTLEYRYIASRRAIDEKRMKDKDVAALYEDAIIQAAIRTVHEVFEGDYAAHCQLVVFNGVVDGIDKATGRGFRACIVSLQAERTAFLEIDLGRVEPRACFRSLKGLSGASLASMQPVQPIRTFDKEDPRFIEADGVLDGLQADQNLMTMAWQDFEVLVRDLFNEMFGSRGADVRVTRTSRDQGVDAVIFDPDPLMGGKTVIQAKRYRHAVPVAAVRELYGTMLNEGAGKGILVTTSHFGPSASEFAKDKPITLVDGANLLHLMHNHGHRIRIDLTEGVVEEDLITVDAP